MQASIDQDEKTASIGNGLLELVVEFGSQLRLAHLRNEATGSDWIPARPDYGWATDDFHAAAGRGRAELWPDLAPPSSEFLLRYTPVAAETPVELTGASALCLVPDASKAEVDGDTTQLSLTVALQGHPLNVTVHTEVREGVPVARRWATVTNTGAEPLLLHQLLSLMLSVRPSYADLELYWVEVFKHDQMLWRQASVHEERLTACVRRKLLFGPYERYHDGSYGCMGWLALRDPTLDEGIFAGWEWSGIFDAEVGDFREGAGLFGLRAGFSDEGDYSRTLQAGESFSTPRAFIGFFEGDAEEAGRATRKAAERLFGLPWPEGRAPMFIGHDTWSNWQDFEDNINHLRPERLDREIEIAREVGVELFILDYGWFPLLGDWRSDPERLPDGVEAVSAAVKEAGMKLGLWMGFGQAHADARVVAEHPEWLVTEKGEAITGGWGMKTLCLGHPPCRDWVLEQVTRVVEDFGVDWLKHDFDLIRTSDAEHHAPKATDSRIESVLGYYYIMENLHERFPDLYLDNWTPSTGGADFGNFQRHHSTLMCDWYSAVTIRSALHGIAHLFPHNRLHAYPRAFSRDDEKSPYHYRSCFFGHGVYLLNDMLQWDQETVEIVRAEIEQMKEDRELFRPGEVYQLLPGQPDHFGWEARFVYAQEAGRGMAQVFRNHDPAADRQIIFRGLEPEAAYAVAGEGTPEKTLKGGELMTSGITVRLDKPFSVSRVLLSRL